MNWSRGLFRVWVMVSICWMVYVGWSGYQNIVRPRDLAAALCADQRRQNPTLGNPFDCFDALHAARLGDLTPIGQAVAQYVGLALGGPAGLLGIGLVGIWIGAGFRQPPN